MQKYFYLLILQYLESIGEVKRHLDSVSVKELADFIELRQTQGRL